MTTNDDSRPSVGIHTGPPPNLTGYHEPDPLPEDDYSLTEPELRAELAQLRAARSTDNGLTGTPNAGQLADDMRKWQAVGVTGEMVQWVATKVWDDLPRVTVPNSPRIERERDRLLSEAAKIISGDREDAYGSARDGFTRTGKIWAAMIGVTLTAEQVAMLLAALKISRLCNDSGHRDSWLDGIGYLALGGDIAKEIADEQRAYEQR